jgi:hypothetical protein
VKGHGHVLRPSDCPDDINVAAAFCPACLCSFPATSGLRLMVATDDRATVRVNREMEERSRSEAGLAGY